MQTCVYILESNQMIITNQICNKNALYNYGDVARFEYVHMHSDYYHEL